MAKLDLKYKTNIMAKSEQLMQSKNEMFFFFVCIESSVDDDGSIALKIQDGIRKGRNLLTFNDLRRQMLTLNLN